MLTKRNILFSLALLVNIILLCFYVAGIEEDKRAAFFVISMLFNIAGVLVLTPDEENK